MGPYLLPGVRTEQVAVYGLAVVMAALYGPFMRIPPAAAWALIAWSLYVVVVAIGAIAPPFNNSGYQQSPPAAGLDNALLPVAVIILVAGLVASGGDPCQLLQRGAATIVAILCVNTIAAVAQLQYGVEFTAWFGGDPGRESVSELAAQLGRYSGLINQPAEAGVLYSIAGLCALYCLDRRPQLLAGSLTLIVVGGVLTASKVFLIGGLPLIAIAFLRLRGGRAARMMSAAVIALSAGAAIGAEFLARWSGLDFVLKLAPGVSGENALALVTANRYEVGGGGTLEGVARAVFSGPWAFGFGANGLTVPYDSGWVEALVAAGVFGVAAQVTAFLLLWREWRTAPRSAERTFLGYAIVLLLGSSLGLPSLTANRVATVVWLLLTCLLFACHLQREALRRQRVTVGNTLGSERTRTKLRSRAVAAGDEEREQQR